MKPFRPWTCRFSPRSAASPQWPAKKGNLSYCCFISHDLSVCCKLVFTLTIRISVMYLKLWLFTIIYQILYTKSLHAIQKSLLSIHSWNGLTEKVGAREGSGSLIRRNDSVNNIHLGCDLWIFPIAKGYIGMKLLKTGRKAGTFVACRLAGRSCNVFRDQRP